MNDLEVLLALGVIPQNIWAIENDKNLYHEAIEQLRRHSSYIRIHHGKLERFFELVNERFDIIYIDACGPLPSAKPNTLRLVMEMIHHERLAPIGALITNFAEPSAEHHDLYTGIMAQFFAPRYNDCPSAVTAEGADPAEAHYDPDYLTPFILKHFAAVYSEFVTRFVVDLARAIVPQRRVFANSELRRKYFADDPTLKAARRRATAAPHFDAGMTAEEKVNRVFETMGDLHLNPSGYPLPTFLRRIAEKKELTGLFEPLFGSKVDGERPEDALLMVGLIEHIIENHWEAASPEMLAAIRGSWFDRSGGLFCDVPMPNLLVNSLFGIYSHPYLVNPRRSRRSSYIAKATQMYTDCLVFDQCRYYFDYWPTIDLVPQRFSSPAFQLVLRACLDRMGRHDWSCSSHPFRGAALAGFDEIPIAQPYDFADREFTELQGSS